MKYRHIIFDIDGTLIDTEKTGVLSFLQTVKELMGEDWSYEQGYAIFGIPSSKVPAMIGYKDEELFAEVWEQHFIEKTCLASIFPGVEDLLKAVKGAGCSTGIVTSRLRTEHERDERFATIAKYFDYVVCAEDTIKHKPFPDPLFEYMRKASEGLGVDVKAEDCIYLGDTQHDYGCAHSAGCAFGLADWHSRGLKGISADFSISSAEEAIRLLDL